MPTVFCFLYLVLVCMCVMSWVGNVVGYLLFVPWCLALVLQPLVQQCTVLMTRLVRATFHTTDAYCSECTSCLLSFERQHALHTLGNAVVLSCIECQLHAGLLHCTCGRSLPSGAQPAQPSSRQQHCCVLAHLALLLQHAAASPPQAVPLLRSSCPGVLLFCCVFVWSAKVDEAPLCL